MSRLEMTLFVVAPLAAASVVAIVAEIAIRVGGA